MYSPYGVSTLSYAVSTPESEMVKISNLCTDSVLFADMEPLPPSSRHHALVSQPGARTDFIALTEGMRQALAGDCLRPEDAEGAHDKVKGDQAVPTPVQSPQPPPPAPVRNIA
ncbi:hypothetical protein Tco_0435863 [Tanacetum coccineum]